MFDRAPDLSITIDKGIPVAGGMAGGSADAAAVLRACGHLWDPDGHPEAELMELAADLGSDVPFALLGGTAVGTGRGEVVTSAMGSGSSIGCWPCPTASCRRPRSIARSTSCVPIRRSGRPGSTLRCCWPCVPATRSALGQALRNDLQSAACTLMPVLDMLLELGPEHGALGSIVSGSGPTCAFLVADQDAALELAVALSASGLCRAVRRATGPTPGATIVE